MTAEEVIQVPPQNWPPAQHRRQGPAECHGRLSDGLPPGATSGEAALEAAG
eukprot:CAMPEP_0203877368 /NCGR_PEP_ID=MMETSP0359-20131031/21972_1 /ASSEMBLY_ACC=CAM_ASM_000338 /TAXON_ID=268821 /ORGANISM="Scrippsiella Hangoei, Strain SHTV-5" /LENGTH=50 /DNA_ID=CAMNT_0050796309 /DNA_START=247 /DNA_END=396 /DNA_ORIENTATION=+